MKLLAAVLLEAAETRKQLKQLAGAACARCVATGERTTYPFGDGSRLVVVDGGKAWAESSTSTKG